MPSLNKENCLKRKTQKSLKIKTHHAAHALHLLIAEGKLTTGHVTDALKRREKLIAALRSSLDALERGEIAAMERTGRKTTRRVQPKAKRRLSAATRAKYRLMGKYMGTVRPLPKAAKAKVKAIREKSGIRAAIAAAKKMAGQGRGN